MDDSPAARRKKRARPSDPARPRNFRHPTRQPSSARRCHADRIKRSELSAKSRHLVSRNSRRNVSWRTHSQPHALRVSGDRPQDHGLCAAGGCRSAQSRAAWRGLRARRAAFLRRVERYFVCRTRSGGRIGHRLGLSTSKPMGGARSDVADVCPRAEPLRRFRNRNWRDLDRWVFAIKARHRWLTVFRRACNARRDTMFSAISWHCHRRGDRFARHSIFHRLRRDGGQPKR